MDLDFQPENLPPKPASPAGGPVPPESPGLHPGEAAGGPTPMVSSQPAKPAPTTETPLHPATPVGKGAQLPPLDVAKKSKLPILIAILVVVVIIAAILIFLNLRRSSTDTSGQYESLPSSLPTEEVSQPTTNISTLPSSSTPAGRDAKRKEDIRTISTLATAYFADNQSYPISSSADKLNLTSSILAQALVPKYTAKLPADPLDPDFFYGYTSADGKGYELSARLEDSTDIEATLVGSKYLFVIKK